MNEGPAAAAFGYRGRSVPGYEILGFIGEGAYGEVHLAVHAALGRRCAIKRVRGAWDGLHASEKEVLREARVLALLDHPNIVHLYDVMLDGTDLVLIMEFVDGHTLGALLSEGTLTFDAALSVLGGVAAALGYLHDCDVVHRDLKPGNILVAAGRSAKLGDFGLARAAAGRAADLAGEFAGTPAYMAPEQVARRLVDCRADWYAYAAVCLEVLTGRPEVGQLSGSDRFLPKQLEAALRAGMSERPAARASPAEVWSAVQKFTPELWDMRRAPPETSSAGEPAQSVTAITGSPPRAAAHETPATDALAMSEGPPTTVADTKDARVAPPIYRPTTARHRVRGYSITLLILLVSVLAAAAVKHWIESAPEPIRVSGIEVEVTPQAARGHCPSSTFRFTGRVSTEGGPGKLTARWTGPNGQPADEVTLETVRSGQPIETTFIFTFRGPGGASGHATLQVNGAPVSAISPKVTYECP